MVLTPRLTGRHIGLLRALVHLASLGFLLWLGYAVPAGLLGGDPVQGLTHYLGKGALHLAGSMRLIAEVSLEGLLRLGE
jgi:sulfoxide reductase heme-binding subunit YedZ